MTNLVIGINADTQDEVYGASAVDWVDVDIVNDKFIFSNGSNSVKDGEAIPTVTNLIHAGVVVDEFNPVIVPKYFLQDNSVSLLKEIHNAGNQDKRYVFAFSFDGVTASEPVLELWKDVNMDSIEVYSLGNKVPSDSWWKGVVTTDALPGVDWVGSSLAGSDSGHFLWLNNGGGNSPLSGAKVLYCNLKIVVPAGAGQSGSDNPVIVVKYTSN